MSETWQQIAVWAMIAFAAIVAIYSGISAWRSLKRGKCGGCGGCGGSSKEELTPPAKKQERIVFLPADQLRFSTKARKG